MNAFPLPHEDDHNVSWKQHAGDIAVAEWAWTSSYPNMPYLRRLWFKPFIMFEKEVTW